MVSIFVLINLKYGLDCLPSVNESIFESTNFQRSPLETERDCLISGFSFVMKKKKNAFSSRTREVKSFSPWFFSHPLLLSLFSILTYFSSSLSPISQMLKANFSSSPLIRRDLILCTLHIRTFLLKYLHHDIAL